MERRFFGSSAEGEKMKKLYEKSEITFAIMWIIIYTVCMGNLRRLGDDSPVLMISLCIGSPFQTVDGLEMIHDRLC